MLDTCSGKSSLKYQDVLTKAGIKCYPSEYGDLFVELDSMNSIIDLIYAVRSDVIVRHPDYYGNEYLPYIEIRDVI